jgi:tetratricopeptide (TPR) repeat protein
VWRARGLADAAPAGARGRLVGRKSELRQFAGVLEACREAGAGQTVVLRGEAGIGKTRLAEEFAALALAQGFAAHKSLVLDFGVGKGQDAIRSLVRSLLGLPGGDAKAVRAQAAMDAIAAGWLDPDHRVFSNDLLDLAQPIELRGLYDAMDNDIRNRGKQDVVAALIVGASGRGPLILMIEDAHWADALTLSHLARMTAAVRDCAAVLVTTTRIEGDPLDSAWRAETAGAPLLTIDLAPLREAEAIELAGGLLEVNEQIARDCIARAEGNPLFLEQLLRNAEESSEEAVPASIQSLVLARMDRLSGPDKAALQAASVIGQRFSVDALRHLIEDPGYDCGGLVSHHLARPEGGAYLFAHALIRDGAYASLLNTRKRELHGRAARWYADDDLVLHAEHLDRAEDPAAAMAYLDAAKALAADYRYQRALALIERGLEVAREAGDKFALTCLNGEMLHDLGSIQESRAAFSEAVEIALDDSQRCRAWIGLAGCMRITDEYDAAYAALEKAEAVAADGDLTLELAQIHYVRGNLHFPLGKIDDCREAHELSLKYARRAISPEAEARALSGAADAEYARGRMITSHDYFRRCIELCREHGFGRIEVANISMLGFSGFYHKTKQNNLEDGLAAIQAARKVGHHRAELLGRMMCVFALVELDDLNRAKAHSKEAQALVRRLGAMRFEAQNLTWMARIATAEGRRSEALELLEQALQISRDTGMAFTGPRALSGIALATEDPERRRNVLEEGEAILRSGAVSHNHFWFYRDAIEVSLDIGDWEGVERYAVALEDYTRPEPLPWCDFFIARGRALAAWGRGRRDAEILPELQRLRADAERIGLTTALPALHEALRAA